jgi:hypothetical protein
MKDNNSGFELSDSVQGLLDSLSRLLFTVGGAAAAIGLGMVLFSAFQTDSNALEQAQTNLENFSMVAVFGSIAAVLGAAWLYWAEEILGAVLLIIGGILWSAPMWMPSIGATGGAAAEANQILIKCAYFPGVLGIIALMSEGISRLRIRMKQGAKADVKFGKEVNEEKDRRSQFLGKCYQLSFCRKFVRERCPIYHSKVACWKERVGCMCEESVIRNAMEGKVIPANAVAAAKFIPHNPKLTPGQKVERCKQCVIYNEHQKHKYQLFLAGAIVITIGSYVIVRQPATDALENILVNADSAISKATFSEEKVQTETTKNTSIKDGAIPYADILIVVIFVVLFAYFIRFVEYLVFKLKV